MPAHGHWPASGPGNLQPEGTTPLLELRTWSDQGRLWSRDGIKCVLSSILPEASAIAPRTSTGYDGSQASKTQHRKQGRQVRPRRDGCGGQFSCPRLPVYARVYAAAERQITHTCESVWSGTKELQLQTFTPRTRSDSPGQVMKRNEKRGEKRGSSKI